MSFDIFEPPASSFVSDSFDAAVDGADRMHGGEAKDISRQHFQCMAPNLHRSIKLGMPVMRADLPFRSSLRRDVKPQGLAHRIEEYRQTILQNVEQESFELVHTRARILTYVTGTVDQELLAPNDLRRPEPAPLRHQDL